MFKKLGIKIMKEIFVYHGGTDRIENPICKFGRSNLDFGQGFYVTDLLEQAITWGKSIASGRNKNVIINRYKLNREKILKNYNCKIFKSYDKEWLEFIVGNRTGLNPAIEFDYVEGGVANDRVIDTINLYISGLMDLNTALGELSKHQPNNQICLLNQEIINKHLIFDGTEQ
ncbi:MAG: DUF3990 domain-containing protein [Bacteroidales bacterium]|nr:DUF3990 domain-containing protein [Bacteroidales bacterium]